MTMITMNETNYEENKENRISNNISIKTEKIQRKNSDDSIFEEIDTSNEDITLKTIFMGFPQLIKNPVYIFSSLSMTTLFFVITVIQFWGSDYMENVLLIDKKNVFIAFVIVCVTSPTTGVIVGGIFSTCLGGYEKKSTIFMCLGGALLASLISIPACFVNTLAPFVVLLWLILFFGGIILPSLTGISITVVPKKLKGQASSLNIILGNLLGYIPAPFLYGLILDNTPNNKKVAMTISLFYSFVGLILCGIAAFLRIKYYEDQDLQDKNSNEIETDLLDQKMNTRRNTLEENSRRKSKKNSLNDIKMLFHSNVGNELIEAYIPEEDESQVKTIEENESGDEKSNSMNDNIISSNRNKSIENNLNKGNDNITKSCPESNIVNFTKKKDIGDEDEDKQ